MISPALLSYVAVMSVTPGPNNLLLATSGLNFGFKRTLPMSLGISLGGGFQCLLTMQALSLMMHWLGHMRLALALAGCAYLLWLSWQLLQAGAPNSKKTPQPFSFLQMAAFQWINPKAWVMAINTALLFGALSGEHTLTHNLYVALAYVATNFPCILIWVVLGDKLRQFLQSPTNLQNFNRVMALMLSLTAIWLAGDELWSAYNVVG